VRRVLVRGDRAGVARGVRGSGGRGAQARGQELGDLHGVERRALAQVVVRDEQGQAPPVGRARVLPDAADQRRVLVLVCGLGVLSACYSAVWLLGSGPP